MNETVADHDETIALPPRASDAPFSLLRGLKRDVLVEQRAGWERGCPDEPEDLLKRWPIESDADSEAANLLVEDYLQRRRRGDETSLAEYSRRFPEHRNSLAGLVSLRSALESARRLSASSGDRLLRLPDVGDQLFGFRLRHPLGRGAFARVFLAEQTDLAGRPVVLKVSAIEGGEPQALAQLQHTNIVPIYSVHEDERAGLRAVCMPYFGGASLSDVLRRAWVDSVVPTRGSQLVDALEAIRSPAAGPVAGSGSTAEEGQGGDPERVAADEKPLDRLRLLSYVRATAWIVGQLAEGLHHAHQRGILHRDIKPSNILISAEGEPLLLDFNLAHDRQADPEEATLGGTVAYMAPEHLRALLNGREAGSVDRRSDIYSLGMVLGEILTGRCLFDQNGSYSVSPVVIESMATERSHTSPSLRESRADIPWGLESIARKCLDPDPDRRYQLAEHLADDLRRFLEDRPLRYAPELSNRERVRKFFRRHPKLTAVAPVAAGAATLLLALVGALGATRSYLAYTEDRLGNSHAREELRAHDAEMTRALCLINTTIDRNDHMREGIDVCERALARYAPDPTRGRPGLQSAGSRLDPAERSRVAEDRRELLLSLAGARVRLAPRDLAVVKSALALLDEAVAIPGLAPSRALWEDRARYLARLGDVQGAEAAGRRAVQTPATGARDHYLLATAYARQMTDQGYHRAIAELDLAIQLNPRHYWSLVQRGLCHLGLGDDVSAAGDFGACIGTWPEFAWGYFNRGCVLDRGGRKAEAVDDYTAALARDPEFVPALLNRGLAYLELGRHASALADFDRSLALGRDDASVRAGRGMALEGLGRHAEADAAFSAAFDGATPGPERDRLLWACGFALAKRQPERAAEAFDEVLRRDPAHPRALYGRAMLAMDENQSGEALQFFDRALKAEPGFNQARQYRAVLLARKGDWARAEQDINRCLEREPRNASSLYAAACVAALAAEARSDRRAADQAVDLLRRAAGLGGDISKAARDPDLAGLRRLPSFQGVLAGTVYAPRNAE